MKYIIFIISLIAIFQMGCTTSEQNRGANDNISPIRELCVLDSPADSTYYNIRLSNLVQLPWYQSSVNPESCITVMLVQMNGCHLCTEQTFEYIRHAIPDEKKGFVVATVGSEADLGIIKREIGSVEIQYEIITQSDANKFGLEFIENYDISLCNGQLVSFKIIK